MRRGRMDYKEAVEGKIENLFITNTYYGALADSVYLTLGHKK